ncbi:MAG: hypothetical protein IJK67_04880 [Bacilli bacterium]|nr:hypothetical protein [Bacilli bacterium]
MDKNYNKEKEIYDKLMILEEGDQKERSLAFDCEAILSDETTTESLESRLSIIENMIKEYEDNKKSN